MENSAANVLAETNARLSIHSSKRPTEAEIQNINKGPPPTDRFFLLHLICLLLGLAALLPVTFFVTANSYWMYKFRDTTTNSSDPNNRTTLQRDYASAQMIAQSVTVMICTFIITSYGHKIKLQTRIRWGLTLLLISFVVFTVFIKVNTDNWQVGFFVMTIATLVLINAIYSVLGYSFIILVSKFPQEYMKFYMYGQGFGGIFGSSLQVMATAIGGDDVEAVALIYFVSGSVVIGLALVTVFIINYLPLFKYYNSAVEEDTQRDPFSLQELKTVVKTMWPCSLTMIFVVAGIFVCHPALTSLVLSEFSRSGNSWNKNYFVPVITFLYGDITSFIGRLFATTVFAKHGQLWAIASGLRIVIFVPLYFYCNAYPRKNVSVIFTHDWEYAIIHGVFNFTGGYLLSSVFLSVPFVAKGQEEMGFALVQMAAGIGGAALSPLGLLIVSIL